PRQEATTSSNEALKDQLSGVLREQLLSQLQEIGSADEAAAWAHRILPAKNSLNDADARQIGEAFAARLAQLEGTIDNGEPELSATNSIASPLSSLQQEESPSSSAPFPHESTLPRSELRRLRDKDHLRFVSKKPCLICGRMPA